MAGFAQGGPYRRCDLFPGPVLPLGLGGVFIASPQPSTLHPHKKKKVFRWKQQRNNSNIFPVVETFTPKLLKSKSEKSSGGPAIAVLEVW